MSAPLKVARRAQPRFFLALALALIAACLGLGEIYRRWATVRIES